MTAKVSRGERILQKWASDPRMELSETGKDWLIAALDPFHDTQLKNLAGWPDLETAHSVVRCVTQNLSISRPAGFPEANWDCHIAALPWLDTIPLGMSHSRNNNVFHYDGSILKGPMGGVAIQPTAANTNADWFPTAGTGNMQCITLPDVYQQGIGRLVGMGYEVYDTTAAIAKQGTITAYRQNEGVRDPNVWTGQDVTATSGTYKTYHFSGTPIRMPPKNLQQAVLFPGNRTWEMKDGLYQVMSFHSNENTPFSVDYNQPVLYPCGEEDEPDTFANGNIIYFPASLNEAVTTVGSMNFSEASARAMHLHPIHQSGCILSGLNKDSTFTVTVKFYYESFPSIKESDILVLATPSAKFDPMALEIYSRALSAMPVGVPVCENGFGDWFYGIVDEIGKFANPILKGMKAASNAYQKQNAVVAPQNNQASRINIAKPVVKSVKVKPKPLPPLPKKKT